MLIKGGQLIHYEGDPIKISFTPTKVEAISFKNRGQEYPIPIRHGTKVINNPQNPTILAELGLKFYKNYLNKIEKKFLK